MSGGDDRNIRRPARIASISLSRRRALGWFLLPAAQFAVPSAWAIAARIASTRLWPAQEYTRVILEGPAPIPHQLIVLRDQRRASCSTSMASSSRRSSSILPFRLQSVRSRTSRQSDSTGRRSDTLRIVFELKAETRPQLFALLPVAGFGHRIVLDLYPLTPARSADGAPRREKDPSGS